MMRKHPRQEMVKASLWMHRDEFKKVAELSGDMSMNLFMMRAVRKAIEDAEEEGEHKEGK
jgi:hypothetical protein